MTNAFVIAFFVAPSLSLANEQLEETEPDLQHGEGSIWQSNLDAVVWQCLAPVGLDQGQVGETVPRDHFMVLQDGQVILHRAIFS